MNSELLRGRSRQRGPGIIVTSDGRTVVNGMLFGDNSLDDDEDGIADIVELLANEINFVLGGHGCDR